MGRTLTSAWIETMIQGSVGDKPGSRTLTSAWIETVGLSLGGICESVALSRVRGLKQALRIES